jgi:tetratricopeptide (TPR) repeat protein
MMNKHGWHVLAFVLLVSLAASLSAGEKKSKEAVPSATDGAPPPGNAMSLSVPQARRMLKETLQQAFAGEIKCCVIGSCLVYDNETPEVRLRADGFDFTQGYTFNHKNHEVKQLSVTYRNDQDYVAAYHPLCIHCGGDLGYAVRYTGKVPKDARWTFTDINLDWKDEATAQKFAEAFNRLVYGAYKGELQDEEVEFSKQAAEWRALPTKPPLSSDADKQWILAENSVKEKDLDAAVEHYEAALEIQPMWPTGWYDLAMIYGEQKEYADAADALKHYLELAPDASDAKAANEQMIIWEDKANTQQQQEAPAQAEPKASLKRK